MFIHKSSAIAPGFINPLFDLVRLYISCTFFFAQNFSILSRILLTDLFSFIACTSSLGSPILSPSDLTFLRKDKSLKASLKVPGTTIFDLAVISLGFAPFCPISIGFTFTTLALVGFPLAQGRRSCAGFGFAFISGKPPFDPSLLNMDLIMLLGSFLALINLPTAFCVSHFAISAPPDLNSQVSILSPPLTTFPAPSIAPIESIRPPIF